MRLFLALTASAMAWPQFNMLANLKLKQMTIHVAYGLRNKVVVLIYNICLFWDYM
jgi:hypothetical protein